MDLQLAGAVVLVTGGASNIGRGIVHGFAREGACILLCDIDGTQGKRVAAEAQDLGAADVALEVLDLTEPDAGQRAVDAATTRWGRLDALVNNAGWNAPGFVTEQTDRTLWQRTIEVNLFSAIACTQAALGPMREAGVGSIIAISSDAAFGAVRQGIYGTSKAGMIAFARTVAREHGRHGIRSNIVCPGLVLPADDAVGEHSLWAGGRDAIFDEAQTEHVRKLTPLRRLTTAEDVAASVVWLSSEAAARQVTGQIVAVGGGSEMP